MIVERLEFVQVGGFKSSGTGDDGQGFVRDYGFHRAVSIHRFYRGIDRIPGQSSLPLDGSQKALCVRPETDAFGRPGGRCAAVLGSFVGLGALVILIVASLNYLPPQLSGSVSQCQPADLQSR